MTRCPDGQRVFKCEKKSETTCQTSPKRRMNQVLTI